MSRYSIVIADLTSSHDDSQPSSAAKWPVVRGAQLGGESTKCLRVCVLFEIAVSNFELGVEENRKGGYRQEVKFI